MILKLAGSKKLTLPNEFDLDERLKFTEDIMNENPECFKLTGDLKSDNNVSTRLDILGTYILNSMKDIRKTVLSRYKEKRRPYQELAFSSLSKHQFENIKKIS
ncbi:hypothetical protein PV797_04925 [Clostridiaceae bacterium M8S5]|nr:hypothetical protein PV797_04925 [Clostridiaceae bacterium M8S5]